MSAITYEKLRKRVSEDLNMRVKDFRGAIRDISTNFRNLGLETAVWYPERIHTANIGGIDADSYIGYSRIEGKWGLIIRTIEHDHESHAFVSQRVRTIESCGDMEIVTNGLRKVRDLMLCIDKATNQQIETLTHPDEEFDGLRNPNCEF
jgi:hypothetical protein